MSVQSPRGRVTSSADPLPAAYVREFIAIARAQQFNVDELLRDAGIGAGRPAPDHAHCARLYTLLCARMDDACLGVHGTNHRTPLSYVRLLLAYLAQAATLGEALRLAGEFFSVSDRQLRARSDVNVPQVAAELVQDPAADTAAFALCSHKPARTAVSDLHDLASMRRLMSCLIGVALPLREAEVVAGEEAERLEAYRAVLDCPIRFGADANRLVFDLRYLDYPLRQTGDSLRALLDTRPYELMFPRAASGAPDIATAVRDAIGRNFRQRPPSLEEVAALLALNPRSLRWLLEKAGTSFQQLKDECLRAAAIDYLQRDSLSVAAIAELLGFSDPCAFNRSFKRLTGVPPGTWRQRRLTA